VSIDARLANLERIIRQREAARAASSPQAMRDQSLSLFRNLLESCGVPMPPLHNVDRAATAQLWTTDNGLMAQTYMLNDGTRCDGCNLWKQ
jgi:hypothetical protein